MDKEVAEATLLWDAEDNSVPKFAFFERAQAVRTEDGEVAIILIADWPSMERGYLLSDLKPSGVLRFSDNGLERLRSAVLHALHLRGLALD